MRERRRDAARAELPYGHTSLGRRVPEKPRRSGRSRLHGGMEHPDTKTLRQLPPKVKESRMDNDSQITQISAEYGIKVE
jgi:hypothetical protein